MPTAVLNSVLAEIITRHNPEGRHGRKAKMYMGMQVGVKPPLFVFFVNDSKVLRPTYKMFLERSLRANFGFNGTSLRLIFRGRNQKVEEQFRGTKVIVKSRKEPKLIPI